MEQNQKYISTVQFAANLGVRPTTVHRSLCVNGHCMGIKPAAKLPNGRLLWPGDAAQKIVDHAQEVTA